MFAANPSPADISANHRVTIHPAMPAIPRASKAPHKTNRKTPQRVKPTPSAPCALLALSLRALLHTCDPQLPYFQSPAHSCKEKGGVPPSRRTNKLHKSKSRQRAQPTRLDEPRRDCAPTVTTRAPTDAANPSLCYRLRSHVRQDAARVVSLSAVARITKT
jgi:hypothetical protein